MHINSTLFELDLFRHSQVEAVSLAVNGTLSIDYRFLAHKYAEQLFGEAQLMRVEPNLAFSDSKKKDLIVLIKQFYYKHPHIKPQEDRNQVTAMRFNSPQEIHDLKKVLKLVLDRLLNGSNTHLTEEQNPAADLSGDSTVLQLLSEEQREFVDAQLAGEIRLKDLKILFIVQAASWNLSNFEEMKAKVKRKFKTLRALECSSVTKIKIAQVE